MNESPVTLNFQPLDSLNYEPAFKLQTACHSFPWSRKVFLDCLTPPYVAEQLVEGGEIQGYLVALMVSVEATLMDIGVAKASRGRGHGKALLHRFIDIAKVKGAQEAWLEVRASNQVAIKLYRQFGFELVETRKGYYPDADGREDGLIMKLEFD